MCKCYGLCNEENVRYEIFDLCNRSQELTGKASLRTWELASFQITFLTNQSGKMQLSSRFPPLEGVSGVPFL